MVITIVSQSDYDLCSLRQWNSNIQLHEMHNTRRMCIITKANTLRECMYECICTMYSVFINEMWERSNGVSFVVVVVHNVYYMVYSFLFWWCKEGEEPITNPYDERNALRTAKVAFLLLSLSVDADKMLKFFWECDCDAAWCGSINALSHRSEKMCQRMRTKRNIQ